MDRRSTPASRGVAWLGDDSRRRKSSGISIGERQDNFMRADRALQVLPDKGTLDLPAPGAPRGLKEPGVFELTFELDGERRNILTSVDAVSDGTEARSDAIRKLFARLRAVGPVICNARTFFGIERDS